MAYDEGGPVQTRRNDRPVTWIVIAVIVIVVALVIIFFFMRPGQEEVVEPVDVVEPAEDTEQVDPVDVGEEDEGAFVPGLRPFVINGVAVMAS